MFKKRIEKVVKMGLSMFMLTYITKRSIALQISLILGKKIEKQSNLVPFHHKQFFILVIDTNLCNNVSCCSLRIASNMYTYYLQSSKNFVSLRLVWGAYHTSRSDNWHGDLLTCPSLIHASLKLFRFLEVRPSQRGSRVCTHVHRVSVFCPSQAWC